jgi:hypothetical protein
MFKMKHFVLAAATVLCAAGAMASNFRVADSVYIPVAAHAAGGSGTFISDIWVQNMSNDAVDVSVIYTRIGQRDINGSPCPADPAPTELGCPKYYNNRFTLQPNERREFVDFMLLPLAQGGLGLDVAQGSLIFNACLDNADCINTQDAEGNSPNYRDIAVFSRVYSIPPGTNLTDKPAPRTVGQTFPGIPWYNYVSSSAQPLGLHRVVITGIRNTGVEPGTYRTNIGLVNASQYSTTTIVVKLFNGTTRAQIGSDFTVRLGPLQSVQPSIGVMFPAFVAAPTSTNAYVTVEQRDNTATNDAPAGCLPSGGCPGFLAFGTILDNLSGDGTTLEAIYEKPLSPAVIDLLYVGKTGGKFRRAVRR